MEMKLWRGNASLSDWKRTSGRPYFYKDMTIFHPSMKEGRLQALPRSIIITGAKVIHVNLKPRRKHVPWRVRCGKRFWLLNERTTATEE